MPRRLLFLLALLAACASAAAQQCGVCPVAGAVGGCIKMTAVPGAPCVCSFDGQTPCDTSGVPTPAPCPSCPLDGSACAPDGCNVATGLCAHSGVTCGPAPSNACPCVCLKDPRVVCTGVEPCGTCHLPGASPACIHGAAGCVCAADQKTPCEPATPPTTAPSCGTCHIPGASPACVQGPAGCVCAANPQVHCEAATPAPPTFPPSTITANRCRVDATGRCGGRCRVTGLECQFISVNGARECTCGQKTPCAFNELDVCTGACYNGGECHVTLTSLGRRCTCADANRCRVDAAGGCTGHCVQSGRKCQFVGVNGALVCACGQSSACEFNIDGICTGTCPLTGGVCHTTVVASTGDRSCGCSPEVTSVPVPNSNPTRTNGGDDDDEWLAGDDDDNDDDDDHNDEWRDRRRSSGAGPFVIIGAILLTIAIFFIARRRAAAAPLVEGRARGFAF